VRQPTPIGGGRRLEKQMNLYYAHKAAGGGKMLTYSKELKPFTRQLRNDMTPHEQIVWQKIRSKQIHGIQFYRQKPIGTFIIDFYAKVIKLAIEIDGGQHYTDEGKTRDIQRDDYLNSLGITVLRFENHEVFKHLDKVLNKIASTALDLKVNK